MRVVIYMIENDTAIRTRVNDNNYLGRSASDACDHKLQTRLEGFL